MVTNFVQHRNLGADDLATQPFVAEVDGLLAIECHRIGDQPPTRAECGPAGFEQVLIADVTAYEVPQ